MPGGLLSLQRGCPSKLLAPSNVLPPKGVPAKTRIVQFQPLQNGPEFIAQQVPVIGQHEPVFANEDELVLGLLSWITQVRAGKATHCAGICSRAE